MVDMELESHRVPAASIQEVPAQQAMFVGADATSLVKNGAEGFVVEVEEEGNGVGEDLVLVAPASAQGAGGYKTSEPLSQYKFHSKIAESCSLVDIFNAVIDTPVTLPLRHIAASCLDVRQRMVDNFKTSKVSTPALFTEHADVLRVGDDISIPYHCPLRELDILLQGVHQVIGVFDTASSLVNIRHGLVKRLGLAINPDVQVNMTMANGGGDS
jgi:Protein of unknown function (DUF4100)